MQNPFNIQPGDIVKLIIEYTTEEPSMNDGELITLPKGWQSEFIRFTDDEKYAELVFLKNPDISVFLPSELISPVKV